MKNVNKVMHYHVKCDICGMIESTPWFEQPMNETIREYARQYVSPPKMFYPNMEEALRAWGYYDEE